MRVLGRAVVVVAEAALAVGEWGRGFRLVGGLRGGFRARGGFWVAHVGGVVMVEGGGLVL